MKRAFPVLSLRAVPVLPVIISLFTALFLGCAALHAAAEEFPPATASNFEVSPLFSDNMVLQQNEPIRVWGTCAEEGSVIHARLADSYGYARVSDGVWQMELAPRCAQTEPLTLEVYGSSGAERRIFENLTVGDVWFVVGQSNVEYSFGSLAEYELLCSSLAGKNIRFLSFSSDDLEKLTLAPLKKAVAPTLPPASKVWRSITHSENVNASALGLCFALELDGLCAGEIPIGIISLGFSGHELAAFVQPEISKRLSGYDDKSLIYNTLIAPFLPMPIRGMIWYQGEANAPYYAEYADAFAAFIGQFRTDKNQSAYRDFSLYLVELPPCFPSPEGYDGDWQYADFGSVRAVQGCLPMRLENCYICSTLDLWSDRTYSNSLHPPNKPAIAKRLAGMAAANEWGFSEYALLCAPTVREIRAVDESGCCYDVFFDHAGEGLQWCGGADGAGFEAVGGSWQPLSVTAQICGKDCVRIRTAEKIYFLRYAYATSSVFAETAALCNAGGIPAAAFSYEITAIPTPFYEYLHIAAVRVIGLFYPYRFGMAALLALCGTLFLLLKIRKRKGKMDQP